MSVRIPLFSCSDQSFNNMICESKLRSPVVFKGITDDGELVFAPYLLSESYCILYFDPSRNSTREALFEGVEGEIRRCCGIATSNMCLFDDVDLYILEDADGNEWTSACVGFSKENLANLALL
ncbi:hypothetical protein DY000_02047207 [Brassica cretica]|uniref:F-box associated beta-propeller type 3 domain-containing protein n=1 Tax=Brassica cretica TaxID=69181 RepID=A0ABQ7EW82_BRACR|nr:hypothetical protein DY000_02047207 [Brassica cretica]